MTTTPDEYSPSDDSNITPNSAPIGATEPAVPADAAPDAEAATESAPAAPAPDTAAAQSIPAAFSRRAKTSTIVAALAIGALVGGVSGAGVAIWATQNGSPAAISSGDASPGTITVNNPDKATLITAVAAKAAPSVVTISVTGASGGGTGSGVILTADGYILTNTHVVTLDGGSADAKVKVQTRDGRLFSATVVGTDPISDLAVIKVDGVTDLTPAEFADSSELNVGDAAVAIGAPLGLTGTVTDGIVSAVNRSITVASSAVPTTPDDSAPSTPNDGFDFWNFDLPGQQTPTTATSTISLSVIQTDAAINPGNSGGALVNSNGEVIGINVAIASAGGSSSAAGSIGVGFSIPSNLAKRVADEIIANGSASHGLLGASVLDVTEDASASDSATVGASVKAVSDGGAAASAGIRVGDVITKFNGIPVTGKTDLTAQVRSAAAGSKGTVTFVRDGKAMQVEVTLGSLD